MTDTIKDFLTEEKRLADSEKVLRDAGFNGWYDWDTWNCALWLGNTHTLTLIAEKSVSYDDFMAKLKAFAGDKDLAECTPDGARWADADYSEMNELIQEFN